MLELSVAGFALLGFAFVPLGQKTALEHVKAIVATAPARDAARELGEAGQKLRQKLLARLPSRSARSEPAGTEGDAGVDARATHTESLMCTVPAAIELAGQGSDEDAGTDASAPVDQLPPLATWSDGPGIPL